MQQTVHQYLVHAGRCDLIGRYIGKLSLSLITLDFLWFEEFQLIRAEVWNRASFTFV